MSSKKAGSKAAEKSAELNGADYVTRSRLTNRDGQEVAAEGATCEHVDPNSLPWLIEQGIIVPVAAGDAKE